MNKDKYTKQIIYLDVDDTIIKSSEEIIRQLNIKNNTNFSIKDMNDYYYNSIDKNITDAEIEEMYASECFFENVKPNDYFDEFIEKYKNLFKFVFVTVGTEKNLNLKKDFIVNLMKDLKVEDFEYIALPYNTSKEIVMRDNVYVCIDDNTNRLVEYNCPMRILIKNHLNLPWNKTPINREDVYVVNTFKEIIEMIDFDLKLKEQGIIIG